MARAHEVEHGKLLGKICRLLIDCHWADGQVTKPYCAGDTVKVVMVSRLGDCGITHDLKAEFGYDVRVHPDQLEVIKGAKHDRNRDI